MSWLNLSDNISNLSGNFSSITGQISSFTREVLTESTEEVFDQDAELKLAKIKINDLEGRLIKQRSELERINNLNEELQEKADSAELQIQALSSEYREVIDSKEKEIKFLQSSHNESRHDHSASRDEMEYEDSEFFHMTIDKLKKELDEVREECQHWKEAAKNQNNQAELQRVKEDHQHEVASLQSMYSQRISQMNKKHQNELQDLIDENEKLTQTCAELENENDTLSKPARSISINDEKTRNLEEKCKKLSLDFEIKKKQLENLQTQMLEEKKGRKTLEQENESLREENERNVEVITDLKQEIEILGSNYKDDVPTTLDVELLKNKEQISPKTGHDDVENIEELDRAWRTKFDKIVLDLNKARDENVELSLEVSQYEEKLKEIKNDKDHLVQRLDDGELQIKELIAENDELKESTLELGRLKVEISRLASCTVELLEELEFQKGLSGEQDVEIESLRKICMIKGTPAEEIKKMQKSLKELGGRYVELYGHYKKVSFELRKSNDRLIAERQLRHTSVMQLREEVSSACQRLRDTTDAKLHSCREESSTIQSELTDLNRQVDQREQIVSELEMDVDYVSDQTAKIVSEFGCQVRQSDLISKESNEAETIDALIAEKEILERTIEGLERKTSALEKLVASLSHSSKELNFGSTKGSDVSTCNSDTEQERMFGMDEQRGAINRRPDIFQPVSIHDSATTTDGFYIDDEHPHDSKTFATTNEGQTHRQIRVITELETNLLEKEKELLELKTIKDDLEFEKSTLEKVVLDLQKQLKVAKEASKMVDASHTGTHLSHQQSATDISSSELDILIEARDHSITVKAELETRKNEMESIDCKVKELIVLWTKEIQACHIAFDISEDVSSIFSPVDIISNSNEESLNSSTPIDKIANFSCGLKRHFSVFTEKFAKLKTKFSDLQKEVSLYDTSVEDALKFISQAWNERQRTNDATADFQAGSCEDKLRKLRSVLESFVFECSGETDADKWRRLHDDAVADKSVISEELNRLKDNLRFWKDKHRHLAEENTSLLETVDLLRQDLDIMSQGQSALAAEREILQTELDKLQFQIDTNETDDSKEIGELKMQLDDLKIERERIMKMVNERDDFITEQQEKHDHLVDQIVEEKDRDLFEIQEQLEETMKLFKDKQHECEAMKDSNERLKKNGDASQTKIVKLEKEVSMLLKERDSLQIEVNERRCKAKENEAVMKSLEDEDEELREKEILEEDMLREQEILIDELRLENVYLRNELENSNATKELEKNRLDVTALENIYKDRIAQLEADNHGFDDRNRKLVAEIAECKTVIEGLKEKVCQLESQDNKQLSVKIEAIGDSEVDGGGNRLKGAAVRNDGLQVDPGRQETMIEKDQHSKSAKDVVMQIESDTNTEKQELITDYVKQQKRVRELEIEIEAYKGFERKLDEKEYEAERYKSEVGRMMQVLRSKDELLLNLEMMEGESANDDSPFSSRARVIQYIRDKEMELSYTQEKTKSLEELAKHNASQLELLKVERQNLMIFMKQKEAETIDLNERLENIQARSAAKEHASAVMHAEHQKLLELNNSQGSEIARLRERYQYLQNVLQEKQNNATNDNMMSKRNEELEIQIAAFQQEQERLLTLIHQKDENNRKLSERILELELQTDLAEKQSRDGEIRKESEKFVSDNGNGEGDTQNYNKSIVDGSGFVDDWKRHDAVSTDEGSGNLANDKSSSSKNDARSNAESKFARNRETNVIYDREIQDYKQQLDMLSKTNSKLLKDYSEIKQKLELVENEKKNIRAKLDEEVYAKDVSVKDNETRVEELKKRIVEITHNFEQERVKISQNYDTRTNLLANECNEKLRYKDNELKSLNEKLELLESVQQQVQKSGKSSNKTVAQIETLTLENRKLRALYEEKKGEISVLQADVHRLKNVSTASEAALTKIQADNRYLIDQSNNKDSEIEELLRGKSTATQRIQELETEAHRLTVKYREVEAKAAKEMERFRNHLITIEEGYTNEAVTARDREVELEQKIAELKEIFQKRISEYEENSNKANFQIQNLQQQLLAVASQRDKAVEKLTQVQEKAHHSETSLYNLQMALEQFQKEKDSQYELLAEQSKKKLTAADKEIEDLKKRENSYQARIQEATLAVQGVANLSNEVKVKDEQIDMLKKQVSTLEIDANSKTEFIKKLKNSTEGKIDKPLMKNILHGYFHTPEAKRPDVVRVIGNLVGFSQEEITEVGSGAPPSQRTWVSSLMPFGGRQKTVAKQVLARESDITSSLSKSFSEMFVSFLEEESGAASKSNRPAANQLTSLLMQQLPMSSSTPLGEKSNENRHSNVSMPISNPLLITSQDARVVHSTAFKTSLPLLPSSLSSAPTPLFPAPGQEVPRVHTSTANSALRTMLAK